jgi:hypothetical protein
LLRGDIRPQNEVIDEEVAYFMEEINKLGEREQIYLKGKIEDMIKTLSKL